MAVFLQILVVHIHNSKRHANSSCLASALDYDSWATEGWDAKTLLRLANKAETYLVDDAGVKQDLHGHNGPICITHGTHARTIDYEDTFAGAEAAGVPRVPDAQDFRIGHGMTSWAKYIGPDGRRQDAAHCYLHPLLRSGDYPNLHILVNSSVCRVRFDGVRATGVEYQRKIDDMALAPAAFIAAKKLVVLSAGALATAPILERSGVGSSGHLRALGIDVVSDLPGVGEDYQDHNLMSYTYKSSWTSKDSYDGLLSGREDFARALADKSTKMGWNGIDVCGKVRPSQDEVAAIGGDFQACWNRDFKDQPSRPMVILPIFNGYFGDHAALGEPVDNPAHYLSAGVFTTYPYSRGSIHITSKDPQTPASFNTGFLSNPVDLAQQVWGYKKSREVVRRSDKYAGEVVRDHPPFRQGSRAACQEGPTVQGGFKNIAERRNLPPIEYDEHDDKVIEEFIRQRVGSSWHSMGTCKMAPRDANGVVDKNLNVYGTKGLKCAGKTSL